MKRPIEPNPNSDRSIFWFNYLPKHVPGLRTHYINSTLPGPISSLTTFQDRSMQVQRLRIIPIESIVRGYITGSGWSEYKKSGTVNGIKMPAGLVEGQKLPQPLWTPSTKAELGDKYDAQKWKNSTRSRSSKQDNGSDCGVFTCFNGLAAAKDMAYKEVTAKKMPAARQMLAGVLINGGFEGDFDL